MSQPGLHLPTVLSLDPNDVKALSLYARLRALLVLNGFGLELDRDCAGHGVHGAVEFHQTAIASRVHDPAVMRGDSRIETPPPMVLQCRERAKFVATHQPAVADDIRQEDCRQAALNPRRDHSTRAIIDCRAPA